MRTRATFRLLGDNAALTAAAVTRTLGIEPSAAAEAGTPVSSRSQSVRRESLWLLSSSGGIQDGAELDASLQGLLAVLEPRTAELWELAEAGYDANWYCWVESHATEHAAQLGRALMARLLALPGDLWLDVCGDGEDE